MIRVEAFKEEAGHIPKETCPDIDKAIRLIKEICLTISYVERHVQKYESAQSLLDDLAIENDITSLQDTFNELRESNDKLRGLGKYWYDRFCESDSEIFNLIGDFQKVLDFVERWNKQDAEKEVAQSAQNIQFFLEGVK